MSDLTRMLEALGDGGAETAEKLLPIVYNDLRRRAAHLLMSESNQTLQGTALVHEAWLRLATQGERRWDNRTHFFSAAANMMRHILVENARRKMRLKRGANPVRCELEESGLAATQASDEVLVIDEALELLEQHDQNLAHMVVLKFYVGLTNKEAALACGTTERTIERQWAYAKAWLFNAIRERQ